MAVKWQLLESYQFRLEQDKIRVFPRERGTGLMNKLCLCVLGDLYFCRRAR